MICESLISGQSSLVPTPICFYRDGHEGESSFHAQLSAFSCLSIDFSRQMCINRESIRKCLRQEKHPQVLEWKNTLKAFCIDIARANDWVKRSGLSVSDVAMTLLNICNMPSKTGNFSDCLHSARAEIKAGRNKQFGSPSWL